MSFKAAPVKIQQSKKPPKNPQKLFRKPSPPEQIGLRDHSKKYFAYAVTWIGKIQLHSQR